MPRGMADTGRGEAALLRGRVFVEAKHGRRGRRRAGGADDEAGRSGGGLGERIGGTLFFFSFVQGAAVAETGGGGAARVRGCVAPKVCAAGDGAGMPAGLTADLLRTAVGGAGGFFFFSFCFCRGGHGMGAWGLEGSRRQAGVAS